MFFLPFLRGSGAQKLNSLKSDFSRLFRAHLAQNRNLGLTPSSDIRIERFKSLTCFFTISKGFVSSEAEFDEVRFFAAVWCSFRPKIVIWAYLLARTAELSDSKS